jgi:hypothetical protein
MEMEMQMEQQEPRQPEQQEQQEPQELQEPQEQKQLEENSVNMTFVVGGLVLLGVLGGGLYWYFSKPKQPPALQMSSI